MDSLDAVLTISVQLVVFDLCISASGLSYFSTLLVCLHLGEFSSLLFVSCEKLPDTTYSFRDALTDWVHSLMTPVIQNHICRNFFSLAS